MNDDEIDERLVKEVRDYAIFMLDQNGFVRTWNAGAERLKGYKPAEIIGRHFSTFYPQEDIRARKPERELEIALADGRVEDEGWRLRKDGSRFWANVVLQIIERNVKSQTQLVDDLLNVSRIVTGNLKIAPQWIDPMSVIHAAVESIRPAAMAKDIDYATYRLWH